MKLLDLILCKVLLGEGTDFAKIIVVDVMPVDQVIEVVDCAEFA